jgi:phage gpG-like protein
VRIGLEIFGDVQLDRELLRWSDAAGNMQPAFERVADDFYTIEKRQFNTQGGYASGGWAPLKPSTLRSRASHGRYGPWQILDDTGDLKASLTEEGAKGAVRRITSDELFVGTDVDYAPFHQAGTSKMVRRRPVELTGADRRRWIQVVQRHLVEFGVTVDRARDSAGRFVADA